MDIIDERLNERIEELKEYLKRNEIIKRNINKYKTELQCLQVMSESKTNKHSETIQKEISSKQAMLDELQEWREEIEKNLAKEKPYLNVNIAELLCKIASKLDEEHLNDSTYVRLNVFDVETYSRDIEEDDTTITLFTQTLNAGFTTSDSKAEYKEYILPIIPFEEREYKMSDGYILDHETINMLDSGLINTQDGEFAKQKWQDFFWDFYKTNIKDELYNRCMDSQK